MTIDDAKQSGRPILVAGRLLSDFQAHGTPPVVGSRVMPCAFCRLQVVLSDEAARVVEDPDARAKCACTNCMIVINMSLGGPAGVCATEHGKRVLRENPEAQAVYDALAKAAKP